MFKVLLRRTAGPAASSPTPVLHQQGYLDARSTHHVAGWMRDLNSPTTRLAFEVRLDGAVLYRGVADRFSQTLVAVGVGDGAYAFHVRYPTPLSADARDRVIVVPDGGTALQHAPALDTRYQPFTADRGSYQGYVDQRSIQHVTGWVRDLDRAAHRVAIEVVLPTETGERVLHRGVADRFSQHLVTIGVGDGQHGFYISWDNALTEAERDLLEVRVIDGPAVELAPALQTEFWPIAHVAMDIVNNCNLRCPFCIVDYSGTRSTQFMSDAIFDSMLRLLPYVGPANFWLSCLHEPTLHPKLLDFIDRVPRAYRHKLFYTTNLAKRMPASYFKALAESGIHHINISIESFDPAVYERMREGARYRIFQENWDALLQAFAQVPAPPRLRYNMMAYRSNKTDLPAIVQRLFDEKQAWQVEARFTYDRTHIQADFRAAEYLTTAEWQEVKKALAHHDPERLILVLPPGEQGIDGTDITGPSSQADDEARKFLPATAPWHLAPRPLQLSVNWEGTVRIYGFEPSGAHKPDRFVCYGQANIAMLPDPLRFLMAV
jgi:wyosine [tRNA(Phe)-imidazoG37] synthetase (radical SAM superfamily)